MTCFRRGNKCSTLPEASTTFFSQRNCGRETLTAPTPRTFQRMLRSTSWIFQYSRKTVHQALVSTA